MLLLLLLVAGVTNTLAQSYVTVSPTTGKLIAARTNDSEVGSTYGWSAMWMHEQLPLKFTVSDETTLTDGGEINDPAGDIIVYNGNLVLAAGGTPDLYMVLSLPKGYKITRYKITFLENLNGTTVASIRGGNGNKTVYETNRYYNTNTPLAQSPTMNGTSTTREYVIERTSLTDDDMTNQLYFKLDHSNTGYVLVTIKSFEVYFTAEGTFDADVKPEEIGVARSVVMSPFKSSKMDLGAITPFTGSGGNQYYGYDYRNVRDLDAYTYLYQENAVQDGVPFEGDEAKHIYPVRVDNKDLYAFGNDTYYIETPTQVHTQSGLESPVGYRIVGARFNYLWGTATDGGTQTLTDHYYITATRNNRTYYLNDQLNFTTNQFAWAYDPETKNLYTGTGANIRYLSCAGSGDTRTLTTSSEKGGYYNLIVFTRNNTTYIGWDNETANQRFYLRYYDAGWEDWSYVGWTARVTRNNTNNSARGQVADSHTIDLPDFNPGTYTLNVYDKTGTTIEKTIDVTESNAGGILELEELNNDAVKFSITNLDDGKQALVSVTLLMQALDPYIDRMDIVCHDPDDQLNLTQHFSASDFTVSGGSFIFYIPQEYQDTELTFTFSDLYSKYGDETYYDETGTGYGRYSFVTSEYFTPINGNGNGGLYDTSYSPNASYTNKVLTSKAGNIRFKFNNAEDLSNTGGQTGTSYLEETPFSVAAYLGSDNPDAPTSEEKGAFIDCKLKASSATQKSDTYYVFTADETRYNIAPTTNMQHRAYAFYRMDIELQAETYTADLAWTKLYNETCYADQDENGKDKDESKAMWGLKLGTKAGDTVVEGYLTVKEIDDAITEALAADGDNHPTSADQILYIDGSELYSIIASKDMTLEQLKAKLSPNTLIYLPERTVQTGDNFANKTASGTFTAGRNIVLTDRKPFYAPYDIQVLSAPNYAMYTRDITWAKNGNATNASIIVPFQIGVNSEGLHDDGEGNKFYVHQIAGTNCLSDTPELDIDNIHMLPVEGVTKTDPNTPYVVKVESVAETAGDAKPSFIVKQTGALVKATTGMNSNYEFAGTPGTGKNSVTFTPTGSFSGKKLAKASNKVYYFANNMFLDIKTLTYSSYLYVYPFRAYFRTSGSAGSAAKKLNIFYGENFDTTSINRLDEEPMTVDPNAPVYDVYGRKIANSVREIAGKKLPRGIYVVNGAKFNVK